MLSLQNTTRRSTLWLIVRYGVIQRKIRKPLLPEGPRFLFEGGWGLVGGHRPGTVGEGSHCPFVTAALCCFCFSGPFSFVCLLGLNLPGLLQICYLILLPCFGLVLPGVFGFVVYFLLRVSVYLPLSEVPF